jgi:ComF family protein
LKNACKQCGLPLETVDDSNALCGQCVQAPTNVDYTYCLYHYESPIDYLVTKLKYTQQLSHAEILGQLLQKALKETIIEDTPDCIVPIPLYKSRLVKRGFNQSLEIAKPVAKAFELPIDVKLVSRNRQTLAQAELNAVQRKKNVRGCFQINAPKTLNYDHIVIIDDVITTGSTINELAKLLKQSGVKKVGVWSIARAVLAN